MARIRTVKPELFVSESLAEVTVEAERTFVGLLTQADDQGRHRDNAAIIAGLLWPLRAEHTSVHVEDDLQQLEGAGLVCRYTGCDGRRYLHIVTWAVHQKIDKPSQSRLPVCPHHNPSERCGPCKGPCTRPATPGSATPRARGTELSPTVPRTLGEAYPTPPSAVETPAPSPAVSPPARAGVSDPGGVGEPREPGGAVRGTADVPAQLRFAEVSPKVPGSLPEPSAPGSRILDPGSANPSGRTAPDAAAVSPQELIGEYVAACANRPPENVIGHLGRLTKQLLAEGIAVEHVRAGLRRFAVIQGHPSRLPSLVNDSLNAPAAGLARPGFRPTVPAHTAWTNPVDVAAAYAEEL